MYHFLQLVQYKSIHISSESIVIHHSLLDSLRTPSFPIVMHFSKPHIWGAFNPPQRVNIAIYVFGIMCYKFGIELFNGSFLALANERFGDKRYERLGLLTGLNYAAQGIGSIAIAPLVKRMPIKVILSGAILTFAVISSAIMIIDSATGGKPKFTTLNKQTLYGNWKPEAILFPIFTFSGVSYGMVELIRRIIPRDIVSCGEVGGDDGGGGGTDDLFEAGDYEDRFATRLKKLDGFCHVCYEISGTAAAISSERLIDRFGYNYSSFLSPILFIMAAVSWWFLDVFKPGDAMMQQDVHYEGKQVSPTTSIEKLPIDRTHTSLLDGWRKAFHGFLKAFYCGAWMCVRHRKYVWLIPGYTFALYGHRYLEYGVVQIFSKSILGNSGLAQVIVGGSNFGELLGALSVMLFTQAVPTPIPWLRLDALALNLVWLIPYFPYSFGDDARSTAWKLAACMIPISYGWAGGDVSLAAYIQSTLTKLESNDDEVSSLGALMAFLYVTYIVLYAIVSTMMGKWADSQLQNLTGELMIERARYVLKMVGGVHFSVLGLIILCATFIPRGAFAINPKGIEDDHHRKQQRASPLEYSTSKKHVKQTCIRDEEDSIATLNTGYETPYDHYEFPHRRHDMAKQMHRIDTVMPDQAQRNESIRSLLTLQRNHPSLSSARAQPP